MNERSINTQGGHGFDSRQLHFEAEDMTQEYMGDRTHNIPKYADARSEPLTYCGGTATTIRSKLLETRCVS